MSFLTDNLTAIIIAVLGLLGGATYLIRKKSKNRSNKVNQSNNKVSGDMAGGDITKTIEKKKK